MRLLKIVFVLLITILMNSCASGYKLINPNNLSYNSKNEDNAVLLEYKYDLLAKKYAKKEVKKGVKVVAIKITNNSEKDVVFGQDLVLTYENEKELYLLDKEEVFKSLKQHPATYLFYLLLTPLKFFTSKSNSQGIQEETSSFPLGLIIGPGLAGGNMIAAGSANKKFKTELLDYNLNGVSIKIGETKTGLIGIKSDNYDAIRIKVK